MMKGSYKVFAWLGVVALVALITLYIYEFTYFTNTLQFGELLVRSEIVAGVLGIWLGLRLVKVGDEMVDKVRIFSGCLLLPLVFAPLAASLSNRILTTHSIRKESFEFFDEKPFSPQPYGVIQSEKLSPEGTYLFVIVDGDLVRLKSKSKVGTGKKRGDQLELSVKRGLWGYDVVYFP